MLVCAIMCLVGGIRTWSSEVPDGPPAELARFAWMVGDWETTATYKITADAGDFEAKSIESVRWSTNKQFLISDEEGSMPDGWHAKLIVTSWDAKRHRYKMVDIDLAGEITELSLLIDKEVVDIVYYLKRDEHYIRVEDKVTHLSDTRYKSQASCTDEDKTWICYDAVSEKKK
jgi:hypothetical protein